MELENSQNNALAKLPMLKLGEYEMWEIRIKQYFQIQDYALWEVIENGNSWVPIPVTTPESGPSTALKMTVPSTTEEKICKKNDVKARSLLLMALPNEHQLTFNQYVDAQSMFIAIKARFGGNDATKKTQKALLKQQYENFNATSSESLDSIFNRLQKLVSRLAILGVDTPPEDLNVKFLRSLPSEWDTHVLLVTNNDDKNLAFLTTSSPSSTNTINTVNTRVSTGNTKVNTASTETSTASFSDATVYAFLSTQPQGSQLVHEDLEQIHDDDLEEMDLKWNMALLSMRARKFYQRTGRKIIIDGSSTAGYDKSKVECFNCHKMGHFARECRAPRSKENRNWNQGSSSKAVRIEDASEKAMCAIDGAGFDWSDMAEDEIQANMALMAFTDSEVSNDKSCSKSCLQNYEALKKQYDDLLVKLDDTGFKAATYKRGLSILEAQVVKYKESEVLFSEEIALLKRSVGHKEYLMGLVKTELEKVKEEKEGFEFKLAKFEKSSKDLDDLLASQVTDKSKRGFGYNVVPSPHPLILNRPTPLDLSYSGLEEFQQPGVNEYGSRDSSLKPTTVCDRESENSKENTDDSLTQQPKTVTETSSIMSPLKVDKDWKEKFFHPANHIRVEEPKKARENTDAPIIEDWVSDDEEEVEPIPKVEKKTAIPTATKKESVKTVKPSRRTVRYAEMYRSQRPRGNQRSWNGQKSNQLGCNFVFNNKACFICGNFDHIQYNCPNAYKHMVPRAVLMKTGLKTVKNAKPLSTVRSVNTARPFNTARTVNTFRPYNTAHPKSTVPCARPKTHFQIQAQSTVQRPFYKSTALTKRSNNQNINTGKQTVNTVRPNVNTVRARGFNASNSQLNEKGFVDSGCSRHMSGNIAHLSDFKEFDGGYVTFGGGANGGRITGKGTIKTDKLDFEDVYFVKELKFNLFSVSQMCDKKNYVLFTDSECLVLSPNFKLPDENQILLKIPRQNNMYSFDMKNIVPKDGLTCLVAKATSEESMLWHRRLGHVNFKNINKLVKENLVRDLPLKRFENDQTCVACLKGKQHRASYKLASLMAKVDEVSYDGNTASLQVNTGSRVISTVAPEVNTATSEGLMGPIPTTEDTQEEDQGIDLGNISPSYAISSTPHTRIHKDHPIDHVIGQQRKKGILVVKINMSIDPEEVPTTQMVKISTFELVAYTDSDYAGATLDRKSTTRGVLRNLWVSEMRRNESVEYSIYHATSQRHRRLVSLDEEFCVCGSIIEVGGGLMKDSLGMKIYGCVFGLDSWEKNLVRKEVSLKPRDAVKDVIAESWRGFVEHVDGLYLNRVGTHTDVIGSLQIEEDIIENEWFAYQAKIEVSRCWGLEGYSGVIEVCRVVVVCKGKVWWGIMVGNVMVCGDGKGYVVYGGERNSGDNEKWIVGEWGWGMVLSECGLIISVLDTHTAWIEVVGEGRGEADTHYLWESESQAYGVLLLEMGEGHSDYTVYEHEDGSIRNNGTDTDGLSQFRGRRSIVRLSGLDFVGGEESIDDASLNHFRERRQRCLAVSIVNLMGGWGKFGWDCDDDDTGVDL
ncbi:ribonuclease H-like domain-containing protein [Tanacetum coccineum]